MGSRTLRERTWRGWGGMALMMGLLVFVPAGTWRYWQGGVFLGVFLGASLAVTLELFRHDPALLERRLRGGPTAESRPLQQVIQTLTSLAFMATLVIPASLYRLGGSRLPSGVVLLGDGLVALGFGIIRRVFQANTFTAATVQVSTEQRVITTGPYAVVRHPMYSGGLVLFVGMPLALGSLWGLGASGVAALGIVWRLLDEEALLARDLAGYPDYQRQTRYRLIPRVW